MEKIIINAVSFLLGIVAAIVFHLIFDKKECIHYKYSPPPPPPKKNCKHENQKLKILEVFGTCETKVVVCEDCYIELTERKTDCI